MLNVPGFTERGTDWNLQLAYASFAAAPSYTVTTETDYNSTRPVERTVYRFQIEGRTFEAFYGRTENNQKPIGTFFWDGRGPTGELLPTGSYEYTIDVTSLNANTQVAISNTFGGTPTNVFSGATFPGLVSLRAPTTSGRIILVNLADSPYGAGWSITAEDRLYLDPDGCIVLVEANASADLFEPIEPGSNQFLSPPGDFTTLLRRDDGFYERQFVDGAIHIFSPTGRILRRTDRYGYVTNYTYDAGGRLSTITSPVGNQFRFFYEPDSAGKWRLTHITDSAGRTTNVEINSSGQLVGFTDATGGLRTFEYDAEHRLTGQQGSRGERSEYVYDNGRVVAALAFDVNNGPLLRERQFEPHVLQGEIVAATASGLGTLIESPIPPVLSRVDRYIDGRGGVSSIQTNRRGLVTEWTDPLGRVRGYDLDSRYRVVGSTRPDGSRTTYAYNSDGRLTRATELFNNASVNLQYESQYGLPTRITDPLGNQTLMTYFPNGNLQSITDPEGNTTTFAYEDGRFPDLPTRITDPLLQPTILEYDARGNLSALIDPLGRRTVFAYDAAGNLIRWTDAEGFFSRFTYDGLNRLTSQTDPEDNATLLTYGESGCGCSTPNLTRVDLPGGTSISYIYDGLNRMIARTDQGGRVNHIEHDPEGSPVQMTLRTGERMRLVNDAIGRIQAVFNDQTGESVSVFEYDVLGNLVGADNRYTSVSMTYDPLGRLLSEQQTLLLPPSEPLLPGDPALPRPPVVQTVTYAYDLADRLTARSDELGTEIFRYDRRSLPTEVEFQSASASADALVWSLSHDEIGRRTRIVFPSGLRQDFVYDAASQLREIAVVRISDEEVIDRHEYLAYTQLGQLRESRRTGQGFEPIHWIYTYSPAGRLVGAERNAVPDGFGGFPQASTYGPDSRLATVNSRAHEHDAEGRLTSYELESGAIRELSWDIEGRLTGFVDRDFESATTVTTRYFYDALGRRAARDVNGSLLTWRYAGLQPLAETLDGIESQRLVSSAYLDDVFAAESESDPRLDLLADRLGSVTMLANKNNDLVLFEYLPFGDTILISHQFSFLQYSQSHPNFTGLLLDPESGLIHARTRSYYFNTGRFLSEDSMDYRGGINIYLYVNSDPINFIDRLGLSKNSPESKFSFKEFCKSVICGFLGPTSAFCTVADPEAAKGVVKGGQEIRWRKCVGSGSCSLEDYLNGRSRTPGEQNDILSEKGF